MKSQYQVHGLPSLASSLLCLTLLTVSTAHAETTSYHLTQLATLGSYVDSVHGLNNVGQSVGYSNGFPVIWSSSGAVSALPRLSGAAFSSALAINDAGTIVGYSGESAVAWVGGKAISLPVLASTTYPYTALAMSINQAGQIVGGIDGRAVLWNSPTATPILLGNNYAMDVNSSGTAVGAHTIWQNGQESYLAGLTSYYHGTNNTAYSINDAGVIVGTEFGAAVKWVDPKKPIQLNPLATPPGSIRDSEAWSINNLGQVVGYSGWYNQSTGSTTKYAVIWDGLDAVDLNSLILPEYGNFGTLSRAVAINDQGQIIVNGIGTTGNYATYLLTPVAVPEPSTTAMTLLGVAMLGYVARRRTARARH